MEKIQIVLASPTDLAEERYLIRELVNQYNSLYIKHDIIVDLRMWENSLPGANDNGPQGLIDLDLEIPRADVFICMYWKSIGTLLEGEDVAGTEHELNIALDSYNRNRKPDIKAFFKEVDAKDTEVKDIIKIKEIEDKLKNKGLYNRFKTKEELKDIIGKILQEEVIKRKRVKKPETLKIENHVHVSSIDSLIDQLKPGSKIYVDEGYYGVIQFDGETHYATKQDVFDGKELVIDGLSDVAIIGEDSVFLAKARYADVIRFTNCENIRLENLTLGHTPQKGACSGNVLCFENCKNVHLQNLNLFGCGTHGIMADSCEEITAKGLRVFECTYGGIFVSNTDISIESSMFYDCQEVTNMVSAYEGSTVVLENVSFYNNVVHGNVIDIEESWLICKGVTIFDSEFEDVCNEPVMGGIFIDEYER